MAVVPSTTGDVGEGVELTVQDSGIGIPEAAIPTLFDRYTQVGSNTTRLYGGTGLGLAIVHQLVTLRPGGECLLRGG